MLLGRHCFKCFLHHRNDFGETGFIYNLLFKLVYHFPKIAYTVTIIRTDNVKCFGGIEIYDLL